MDNAKTIEMIADWISEDNPDVQLFLPQHLEQKGWSQFDYNFFWFCFISGITPDAADYIYKSAKSEIDTNLLSNQQADYEARLAEWDKLYYLFEDFWSTAKYLEGEDSPEIHPIAALIQLPDSQVSIGGQLEARTAEYFHIPVYQISINDRHPDVQSKQSENILSALSSNGPGLLNQPISPVVRFHIIRADLKTNPVIPIGDAIQFTLPGVTPLPQDHK